MQQPETTTGGAAAALGALMGFLVVTVLVLGMFLVAGNFSPQETPTAQIEEGSPRPNVN